MEPSRIKEYGENTRAGFEPRSEYDENTRPGFEPSSKYEENTSVGYLPETEYDRNTRAGFEPSSEYEGNTRAGFEPNTEYGRNTRVGYLPDIDDGPSQSAHPQPSWKANLAKRWSKKQPTKGELCDAFLDVKQSLTVQSNSTAGLHQRLEILEHDLADLIRYINERL